MALRGVQPAEQSPQNDREGEYGRLTEVVRTASSSATTLAVSALLEAQHRGEPTAWVLRASDHPQSNRDGLFPPDLSDAGLDLDALLVVHVPSTQARHGLAKAAELILRTGAFGAVVVDVSTRETPRSSAWLNRLAALAREHDCHCLLLNADDEAADNSLGPLIATRIHPRRHRLRPGHFKVESEVLKHKQSSAVIDPCKGRLFRGPSGAL